MVNDINRTPPSQDSFLIMTETILKNDKSKNPKSLDRLSNKEFTHLSKIIRGTHKNEISNAELNLLYRKLTKIRDDQTASKPSAVFRNFVDKSFEKINQKLTDEEKIQEKTYAISVYLKQRLADDGNKSQAPSAPPPPAKLSPQKQAALKAKSAEAATPTPPAKLSPQKQAALKAKSEAAAPTPPPKPPKPTRA